MKPRKSVDHKPSFKPAFFVLAFNRQLFLFVPGPPKMVPKLHLNGMAFKAKRCELSRDVNCFILFPLQLDHKRQLVLSFNCEDSELTKILKQS